MATVPPGSADTAQDVGPSSSTLLLTLDGMAVRTAPRPVVEVVTVPALADGDEVVGNGGDAGAAGEAKATVRVSSKDVISPGSVLRSVTTRCGLASGGVDVPGGPLGVDGAGRPVQALGDRAARRGSSRQPATLKISQTAMWRIAALGLPDCSAAHLPAHRAIPHRAYALSCDYRIHRACVDYGHVSAPNRVDCGGVQCAQSAHPAH